MKIQDTMGYKKALVVILMIVFTLSAVNAAPARVSAKPMDEPVVKVYTYKMPKLALMTKASPGFLAELAEKIIIHPEYPTEVQVLPAAVLMKYSLIQSVGVAAIALESDFSGTELKDLIAIPLYEKNGKVYSLFLNQLNKRSAVLYDSTLANLEQVRSSGIYDELLERYDLD